jgi:hypothetical protein
MPRGQQQQQHQPAANPAGVCPGAWCRCMSRAARHLLESHPPAGAAVRVKVQALQQRRRGGQRVPHAHVRWPRAAVQRGRHLPGGHQPPVAADDKAADVVIVALRRRDRWHFGAGPADDACLQGAASPPRSNAPAALPNAALLPTWKNSWLLLAGSCTTPTAATGYTTRLSAVYHTFGPVVSLPAYLQGRRRAAPALSAPGAHPPPIASHRSSACPTIVRAGSAPAAGLGPAQA